MKNDGRYQSLAVPYCFLLDVVRAIKEPGRLALPVFPNLPEDVEILGVREDWERRCLVLQLWSASFPVVLEGTLIPYLNDQPAQVGTPYRMVRLERGLDTEGIPTFVVPAQETP